MELATSIATFTCFNKFPAEDSNILIGSSDKQKAMLICSVLTEHRGNSIFHYKVCRRAVFQHDSQICIMKQRDRTWARVWLFNTVSVVYM